MCSFIKPGMVLLSWCSNQDDPQYEISKEAFDLLTSATDAKGRKLEVVKIELPEPIYMSKEEAEGVEVSNYALSRLEGDRLPASYVNFYFVNNGVIVPQFGTDQDAAAMKIYKKVFKGREIIGLDPHEFLLGGGGIHCMTMQVPEYNDSHAFFRNAKKEKVKSVISKKVEVKERSIDKLGMFAKEKITKGEVVYIKGGYITTKDSLISSEVIGSYLPIEEDYYIASTNIYDEDDIKLYNNHSCEPNCGMQGDITFIAIRDINQGEELTIDYAFIDDEEYSFFVTAVLLFVEKL